MSGGVPARLHAQYLPQGKEKLLLRDILCLKEEVVYLLQHFYTLTELHKENIKVESPSKWTSTTPVVETSERIEPNDTNLEVNAISYTFSKIF